MSAEFVGWMRKAWKRWEPMVRGDDVNEVWDRLNQIRTTDCDGERLVLPPDVRPIAQSLSE